MPRSCQSLNPPSNALLLFSNRPLCGLPNLSALPLPSTTYSGSSTAIRRFSALAAKAAVEQIGAPATAAIGHGNKGTQQLEIEHAIDHIYRSIIL